MGTSTHTKTEAWAEAERTASAQIQKIIDETFSPLLGEGDRITSEVIIRVEARNTLSLCREASDGVLAQSIESLGLFTRTRNALINADIRTVRQLVKRTETHLLRLRDFGRKCLTDTKERLAAVGLSLGLDIPVSAEEINEIRCSKIEDWRDSWQKELASSLAGKTIGECQRREVPDFVIEAIKYHYHLRQISDEVFSPAT